MANYRTSMNVCHYFQFCFKFRKGRPSTIAFIIPQNEGFHQHGKTKGKEIRTLTYVKGGKTNHRGKHCYPHRKPNTFSDSAISINRPEFCSTQVSTCTQEGGYIFKPNNRCAALLMSKKF